MQRSRTEDSSGQRDVSPIRDHNGSDLPAIAPRKSGGSRRPSGSRICGKCGEGLTGQFVRALGDTYHLECFTCHVGSKVPFTTHTESVDLEEKNTVSVLPIS